MEINVAQPPRHLEALSNQEISDRIRKIKKNMGDSLLILGHHYQRDEVIDFADARGDSFGLAKQAAQTDARYIVFCGVHFMAETADIVTDDDQKVFIPDVTAGCFLADCADIKDVENAWDTLFALNETVIPVSYVNSSVDIKDFCGRHNGIICTSSIADNAMQWAFERGQKIFFLPDRNLGLNTAKLKMDIPEDEILVWNPDQEQGGLSIEELNTAKV